MTGLVTCSFNFSLMASTLTSMSLRAAFPPKKLNDRSLELKPTKNGFNTLSRILLMTVVAILTVSRLAKIAWLPLKLIDMTGSAVPSKST